MKKIIVGLSIFGMRCLAFEKSPLPPEKISIAMLNVTVYRNPQYDAAAWAAVIERMRAFQYGNFSIQALKDTVDFMYETSCKSQGVWGGAPITLVPDAESFDGPKKLNK